MAIDRRYFVDIFGDIVDSMRSTGIITNSVEVSRIYTLTTVNSFVANNSITILGVDYLIISATASTIVIRGIAGLDFTGETWKDRAPFYEYGHAKEIANKLDLKNQNQIDKFGKFPLIWLMTDLKESSGDNYNYLYTISNQKVFIVTNTNPVYTSQERTTNSFKPILQPLYDELVHAILYYRIISTPTNQISKDKYDRYAWGSQSVYGNDKLIFNDWLDAIETDFKEFNVFKKTTNC